jgi:hypothetical protein
LGNAWVGEVMLLPGRAQIGKAKSDWRVRCIAAPRNQFEKLKDKGLLAPEQPFFFFLEIFDVVKTVETFWLFRELHDFFLCS